MADYTAVNLKASIPVHYDAPVYVRYGVYEQHSTKTCRCLVAAPIDGTTTTLSLTVFLRQ
ncbi:hypothetical protein S886_09685 [Salmonella enterica subsp. arizonae]|nr:hypothetical protein [Salmonella enterica]ECF6855632.1 hypothetical protein [Salmonella enterica subsp. arizonae]EDW1773959.1 hypothetical protein [Salmonella enterica subsp. diarizonae]EDW1844765.1 hypothetical protein [Salmonella enterica subsp. enterica]